MSTDRRTLADALRAHARSRPATIAFADGDRALTWPEAAARVHRCANALRDAGVRPGDRVAWLGQNSFRLQELLVACCEIGAMFCPVNWRQQPDELAFVIDDLAPAVVVWQEEEVGPTVRAAVTGRSTRPAGSATTPTATRPARWVRVRGLRRRRRSR